MSAAPISFRLSTIKGVWFCLAIMFAPMTDARVSFDMSATVLGGTGISTLILHTNGQEIGFTNRVIQNIDLTFATGDGQTFHDVASVPPMLINDFTHDFVYLSAGVFFPSITGTVSGVEADAALTAFTQSVDESVRVIIVTPGVPEPATTAMLIAGLALLVASRGRKLTNGNR